MKKYIRQRKKGHQFQSHFRVRIPKDLISYFQGTREFQISLKNVRNSDCLLLTITLRSRLEVLFSEVREGMKSLTIEQIKEVLRIEVNKQIDHSKHIFLDTNKWNESEKEKSLESVSSREKKLKSLVSEDLDTYKEKIDSRLETILRGMNIEVNNNSIPFKQLRMSFIDLYLMRFEWMRDLINFTGREDDDFRMEVDEKLKMNLFPELITQNKNDSQTSTKSSVKVTTRQDLSSLESTSISVCIEGFLEEKGGVRLRTNEYIKSSLNLLIEEFGDVPIGTIDKQCAVLLKSHLVKLPKNRKKNPQYRDKDYHTLIGMNVKDTISVTTINEHLSYLSSFMEWSRNHGYANQNPFTGLKLPKKVRPRDERDRFSEDEIKKIFAKENYIPDTKILSGRYELYWIPLISVFSGMRLGEICPLYLDNIIEIKKRWCINILEEENRSDKPLKNLSSRRIVPIHDVLIDLGFLEFVELLKKKDSDRERIFQELPFVAGHYNKNVGRFFNQRYLVKLGIKTQKKTFHSLRHTVSDHLKQKGVEPHFINELLGHSQGNIDLDRYGKGYNPDLIYKKCVKKIIYVSSKNRGIDFKSLKVDWKKIIQ